MFLLLLFWGWLGCFEKASTFGLVRNLKGVQRVHSEASLSPQSPSCKVLPRETSVISFLCILLENVFTHVSKFIYMEDI